MTHAKQSYLDVVNAADAVQLGVAPNASESGLRTKTVGKYGSILFVERVV